jgi:ADP-dependent NAD(P)H-hydrate dehydratase / NAD(P)H-hydrate epimerase
MQDYWLKQTAEQALFPDLLWSRPENKARAGKLLVVGGNVHGFAAAGTAYSEALKAGVGTVRVLLPDRLQKTVSKLFPEAEFAPSTPSGSFGRRALAELLELSAWADAVLLAGDFGRNSETAILLESFVQKYSGQLTLTKDAADYFTTAPQTVINRLETLLVISFAQLQKIGVKSRFPKAFTFDMGLVPLVENLHEFTQQYSAAIVVKHHENILVGVNGQVSSTKLEKDLETWRVATAAHAATWWLQNPGKPFEALTISLAA